MRSGSSASMARDQRSGIERQAIVERAGHAAAGDRRDVVRDTCVGVRRAPRGCGANWCARASTRVWRADSASLRRWWAKRKGWRRRHACLLLAVSTKYRGVAVVRPVSADWVPYVDLHLQTSLPTATLGCSLFPRFALFRQRRGHRAEIKAVDAQGHHLASRFPPEPGTLQPRNAHCEDRRRTSAEARAGGGDRASRKPASWRC